MLGENARGELVKLVDKLEDGVLGDSGVVGTELLESKETGVLYEHCV